MHRIEVAGDAVSDTLVIKLSRKKLVLLLLISLAFIAAAWWMLTFDDEAIREVRTLSNPVIFRAVGIAALIFGVVGLAITVRKFFDSRPGLVLSAEGLHDNSSGVSAGLIPWSDVTGFQVGQIQRTKFVVILVKDNEKYLQRGNALQKALHRANTRMVGSPLSIASTTLDIGFEELCAELEKWRAKYGEPMLWM